MKKLLFILLTVLVMACSSPVSEYIEQLITEPIIDDPRIIGNWERGNLAWTFNSDNTFRYFNRAIDETYNTGIYNADPMAGTIYIEDPAAGESQLYIYDVITVNTLRWATVQNPGLYADWVKF